MGLPVVAQAGAIVYRGGRGGLRFLLVRARKNPDDWIFPKGHVEANETADQAALREAAEEAGVEGRILAALPPPVTFSQGDRRIEVEYFLVEFDGRVEASERREQLWLPPPEALVRLTHTSARDVLERALKTLRAG
jgi:8-oxo-dGTP pyrophosphatase MutT (NUDIX family)